MEIQKNLTFFCFDQYSPNQCFSELVSFVGSVMFVVQWSLTVPQQQQYPLFMQVYGSAHIIPVTRVNQQHLYSVIQFTLDRTEPGKNLASITTQYHAIPYNSSF